MTQIVPLIYFKSITSQSLALAPFVLVANWLRTPVRASICIIWKVIALIYRYCLRNYNEILI